MNVCRASCGTVFNKLLVLSITVYFHYNIWGCMCSTGPFQYRWLKGYIYSSCYYHHQIGSIHLSCCYHIFSCDQAALQMVFSVCLSVRLSVCPSHLFDYVPIIVSSWNFQELLPITNVRSMQKVKVTEVTTQLNRFRTVTPVWIHIWWWNDAYSLMLLRRGALLFCKVIRQISRSHGSKNRRIWPRLGVSGL